MSSVKQFNEYRSKINKKIMTAEVHEAMGVATLFGGTIVIPHLRRAFEYWEELHHV